MADDTEADLTFDPDWKRQVCDLKGNFFDRRAQTDYQQAVDSCFQVLLKVKDAAYREKVTEEGVEEEDTAWQVKAMAVKEARQCVDSLDWKRHALSLSDPDPLTAGRIRIVRDFAAEAVLAEVSRSEMNNALGGGAYPALRANGVTYVGLGRRDMALTSDQVIEHFALPRDKSGEPEGEAERSDLRLSYQLGKAGGGAQFALVDDCASGRWTIKRPGKPVRSFVRRGGGQQAVILEGGEQFTLARVHDKALAWNRTARRPETVDIKETARETPCASQHRQSLTYLRQNSL